jgi:hypothetical protein
MTSGVQTGNFVHVVAAINTKTNAGKILYVNSATTTIASDAPPDPNTLLRVYNAAGEKLLDVPVVIRRSSPEHDRSNDVGLIQADLPKQPGPGIPGEWTRSVVRHTRSAKGGAVAGLRPRLARSGSDGGKP